MKSIKSYRQAGVPIILLETADPAEVLNTVIIQSTNGMTIPVLCWDCIHGLVPGNSEAEQIAEQINGGQDPAIATGNPVEFLRAIEAIQEQCTVVAYGLATILNDGQSGPVVQQALWNLRDVLKLRGVMLVLTSPLGYKLPASLQNDVVTDSVPLPNQEQQRAIIERVLNDLPDSVRPLVTDDMVIKAVDAVSGLSGFAIEQVIALSLSKNGMDVDALWEMKRRQIEQTPGLSVWRGGENFSDIGGCWNAKRFFSALLKGKRAPACVVFLDEIEKSMAGAQGDTSGVSQGMLGAVLTAMQDNQWTGAIFIGPPGAAKSALAKAIGNEASCPTISWDLSGTKASLVGESEARTRSILQVLNAVGGPRCLFIATCNSIASLPPELRRRFTLGTFFFDLPTADERLAIWKIWSAKYNLPQQELPGDEGWTGAEIRQCCDLADRLSLSLVECASFVVPVAKSAADVIENLRRQSSGKFLSANAEGVYRFEAAATAAKAPAAGSRRIEV